MDDVRNSLTLLAERGTPLGAEEMISRLEDAMGGDTVVLLNEAPASSGPGRQRSALWVMAAVVSMVMVSVLYWAIADSEVYFDAAGSPPGSPEALFPERMATIEAMVEAHNSGDFDAYRSHFTEQPNLLDGAALEDHDWDPTRAFMAAGEVWEITGDCEVRGRDLISCPFSMTNELMRPAGIWFEVPAFLVGFDAEGGIRSLNANSLGATGSPDDYLRAFDAWLAEIHPDVHRDLGPRLLGGVLPTAEDMPIALRYVDEFLEYSEVYPLSD